MANKRQRKRPVGDAVEIPMTPMIDVVFQLLIYFLVTIKPVDVIAHLDVFRPQAQEERTQDEVPPKLIRITVGDFGYMINDRRVGINEMETLLQRLASFDRTQTILIMVLQRSRHESLVRVLDICAQAGLTNLSVVSTN
ncbi:MAG: biopolymer transporter ExbD [Candidatus Marinimicrobia bacterium]|nr:biopolymer transporter ExbD [Candidatus Neomarinimicrobiota bacterium]